MTAGKAYGTGFVKVEHDGRWKAAASITGGRFSDSYSVSCAPAGRCAAGGYYTDRHGRSDGFVTY